MNVCFFRPIVPTDDEEENIRRTVITNQLRHCGIEIATARIELNDREKVITHILQQNERSFTKEETYRY